MYLLNNNINICLTEDWQIKVAEKVEASECCNKAIVFTDPYATTARMYKFFVQDEFIKNLSGDTDIDHIVIVAQTDATFRYIVSTIKSLVYVVSSTVYNGHAMIKLGDKMIVDIIDASKMTMEDIVEVFDDSFVMVDSAEKMSVMDLSCITNSDCLELMLVGKNSSHLKNRLTKDIWTSFQNSSHVDTFIVSFEKLCGEAAEGKEEESNIFCFDIPTINMILEHLRPIKNSIA